MSKILAIDLGEARVGMALSDESQTLASGYGFVEFEGYQKLIERLSHISQSENLVLIAIGHPINLDGSSSKSAKKAEKFAATLKDAIDIEVKLVDERLTTVEASRQIHASGKKVKKGRVDEVAATIILQALLDARKEK